MGERSSLLATVTAIVVQQTLDIALSSSAVNIHDRVDFKKKRTAAFVARRETRPPARSCV